MERFGIVYIASSSDPEAHAFTGYWDRFEPSEMLEQGPGWDDVDEAIAWGRQRATHILVRLGSDDTSVYSAGEVRLSRYAEGTGDTYPEWPPRA